MICNSCPAVVYYPQRGYGPQGSGRFSVPGGTSFRLAHGAVFAAL